MKKFIFFIALLLVVFVYPLHTHASNITLSSMQIQMQSSDEYTVTLSLSLNVASGSAYFLRGVFFKPNTTNYCGYTWNGSSWYNGLYTTNNGWKNLLPITIDNNNSWSGQLKAKIDKADSGCQDTGTYNFKIERYTNNGSSVFDDQAARSIQVIFPTPTSTPAPTSIPINASTPDATPSLTPAKVTLTISPATHITTISPDTTTILPISIDQHLSQIPQVSPGVLGLSVTATVDPKQTKVSRILETNKKVNQHAELFFLVGGVILLITCGIVVGYQYMKNRN